MERNAHRAATPRALVIGGVGSAILTASSLYVALKMGALPWPIVFAALASVVILRALGDFDLHEANVCHAAMGAGAMVAGGLAFTIPGIWILDPSAHVPFLRVMAASVAGTALGLFACAVLRPHFILRERLPYPIGLSAAETLRAAGRGDASRASGRALFGGMGLAAAYALLRDALGALPAILLSNTTALPGVALGIQNSPMMLSVGFIAGPVAAGVWFLGGLVGNVGIAGGGVICGLIDVGTAESLRSSLGLGLMLGVGVGTVVLNLAPLLRRGLVRGRRGARAGEASAPERGALLRLGGLLTAAVVCAGTFALGLGLIPSVLLVLGTWLAAFLASYLTGTTGIDPMELFGVLLLILVQALFREVGIVSLFLLAAVVAVACGTCGDVMNDLRAGEELGTDWRDQMAGMVAGGLIGAVVAVVVLFGLVGAFGTESFGAGREFVAAQASVVATMAGGIPHLPGFLAGAGLGLVLGLARVPAMTLGLGVYLPFHMSAAAGLGALARFAFDRAKRDEEDERTAIALASGMLGGESLVGVVSALAVMAMSLLG